jgi:hypothetical protein
MQAFITGEFMQKRWKILNNIILLVPSSLVLLLHAYLGSFNRFIADDFCSYYYAKELGVFGSALYWYRTWHGGYSVSFMDSLLVLIGPYGMPYVVPVVLLLWLVVTVWAVRLLLAKDWRGTGVWKPTSLGITLVFSILLISPNIPQSLYWWGGMRAYVIPIIVFTFYIALYLWFRTKTLHKREMFFWSGVSFTIIFASGGFSETFTPVQLVFFVFFIGYGLLTLSFRPKDQEFFFLLAGYFGALASLIAMVSAPGNAARQALYPESVGVFKMFDIAFAVLQEIFITPEKLLGILGVTLGVTWVGMQAKNDDTDKLGKILICLIAGLTFTFLCFIPAAYGLGLTPYARTLIIPAFMLVVSLLMTSYLFGNAISSKINSWRFIHYVFFLITTILLASSVVIKSHELYTSRHVYSDYAKKWDQVDTKIKYAKLVGQETVHVPSMLNWAGLDRPTDNPKFWLTACYSQYYGIQVLGPAWEW